MKKIILIMSMMIFGGLFMCYTNINPLSNKECTKENVYAALKELKVTYPDVVFAQIMLESGNLKSQLSRTHNNFLGMKMPKKRATTAITSKGGYAVYRDWYSCLEDYFLYQKSILDKKDMTKKQYISFIGKKYSQCSTYKQRVLRVIKENRNVIQSQDSLYVCSTQ